MGNRRVPIDLDRLKRLYLSERWTLQRLGVEFGCDAQTILNRLRSEGVPTRGLAEAMAARPVTWGVKISVSLAGRKLTEACKAKISATRRRRRHPAWNKGKRKATHDELAKVGNAGSRHWNWKGGISAQNIRLRQSSEYKAWRDAVFKRDRYACQFCERRGGKLEAHHIIRFEVVLKLEKELRDELIWNPDNGWTSCKKCHREIHAHIQDARRAVPLPCEA